MLILDGDGIDRRNSHDGQITHKAGSISGNAGSGGAESMLGYICKYTPVEIFEAMGIETKRIEPEVTQLRAGRSAHASQHLQLC